MQRSGTPLEIYRLLVENSLGLLCIHDLDGVLLAVNPAVAQSLGYELEDGIGNNLRNFLAPAVRHLFDDYLRRIRENRVDSGLMRVLARDGTERIWLYRNILYDEEKSPPVVLGHALDVTERIAAEHSLKESQRALARARDELALRVAERTSELQQANERLREEIAQRQAAEEELLRSRKLEALGVLAGGIAHDFNNYLTIVRANLELAGSHLPEGDSAARAGRPSGGRCRSHACSKTPWTWRVPARPSTSISKCPRASGLQNSMPLRSVMHFTMCCSMQGRRCPLAGR
jgi:PAS domain S-box-containing protein